MNTAAAPLTCHLRFQVYVLIDSLDVARRHRAPSPSQISMNPFFGSLGECLCARGLTRGLLAMVSVFMTNHLFH